MARYSADGTENIYEIAKKFLNNCLLRDGSLLFEGESVWRLEVLERLRNALTTPDESDRTFLEKFEDQVRKAGAGAPRLAAEILSVYFLFPSNVGPARKRQVVNDVLRWGGDTLSESHSVWEAFAHGIGSGGQGYNTRRHSEMAFLIEFAIEWKKKFKAQLEEQSEGQQKEEVLCFVDSIDNAESRQLRHMLLHLLFPDDFERIASGNHKRRVIRAFARLITDKEVKDDDQLSARSLKGYCPTKSWTFTGRRWSRLGTMTAKAHLKARRWRSSSTRSRSSSMARRVLARPSAPRSWLSVSSDLRH